jgi:alpha-L-rhamnosidase
LQFGLLTEPQRLQAVARLTADIRRRGDRLSTGFLGVGYLLPALTDNGCLDTAYTLLTQEEFPSWMYSIKHGATTIWERWDGWTAHNGFQTPSMNSFNHYSLGSVGEWMFRYMAGIEADPQQPGFKHTIVRPRPGGRLEWVEASYESQYGPIRVSWKCSGQEREQLRLYVHIPANTTATVHVPGTVEAVNGIPAAPDAWVPGCLGFDLAGGEAVFRVGSGSYEFVSRVRDLWRVGRS